VPAAPEKILVIKLGALGDFIQAAGPMQAIRKSHPNAEITLLTTAPFLEFAQACNYFNHIWLDKKPRWFQIARWQKLKRKLNEANFTRVYDLQNSDRTALYFKLFSPKPEWVGAVKGASHRNNSPERIKGHAFDGHVQTLSLAGINNINVDPLLWLSDDISHFALKKPFVLLVPGASPGRSEKCWPAENFAALAKNLAAQNYQPVILGSKNEKQISEIISRECPSALDLTGKTSLAQIASLARNSAACIGNDTGPVHLIAATGCPVLALFSGTSNISKHGPKGENVQILQENNLESLKPETVLQNFKVRNT